MNERKQFRAIKGTRDITPPDSALWNWFERTARETFESLQLSRDPSPDFRGDVACSRVLSAARPTSFRRRCTRSPTVRVPRTKAHRPTAGELISLAPGSHRQHDARVYRARHARAAGQREALLHRPMFRRERPQKGRYRQFYQIGAEVLGQSDAPAIDAEVIEMLILFFQRVGLTRTTLYINSIGDKNCRPAYVELLREELRKVKEQLGADSQRRIDTNPLRVLDSKVPHEQEIIAKLPRIADHLCDACRENYAGLKELAAIRVWSAAP